ncbi:unnamed protein product [Candida parapsilosis]
MSHSSLSWLANLNVEQTPHKYLRRSSIIGTIGPKTNSVEALVKLRKAGLNIARMNFSHGSYEYHQSVIDNCIKSEEIYKGRPLAIALDTKGPEIRTGTTIDDKDYPIPAGHDMIFTTDDAYKLKCNDEIIVRSINAGKICSHKGVNLPGTDVDLPALSEKDIADIQFGIKNKVHMIFASFIRSGDDIRHIRKVLGEEGKDIQIIAKIENQQGVNNFDDILEATDGVMVARGDLGIEIPAPQVFVVQKQLIAKCNLAAKPVICATQMLESMTYNPRPTRAEVSDVGNAILDGADCVMLSGETAKGNYPYEAVSMMHNTCLIAEKAIAYPQLFNELRALAKKPTPTTETCAVAAVSAAYEQDAKAVVVLSTSGLSARLVSKYKPDVPILMVTRNERSAKYSHLYRGVYPFVYEKEKAANWQEDVENRLRWAVSEAIDLGIISKGDSIVTVQGWTKGSGHSNTVRIVQA